MRLGEFEIPKMDGLAAAFGADRDAYPSMSVIPDEHRKCQSKGCKVFSSLFYSGGKLEDHGLRIKAEVDANEFYTTLRALMTSFAPPHELKTATCGWLIESHTESAE